MDLLSGKYVSDLRNQGMMPVSRRVYASLLDSFLLIVVSFCCLLSSNAIAGAVPSYAEKVNDVNVYRDEMYKIQEETKLFSFEKNEDGSSNYDVLVNQNKVFEEWAYSNILYTYSLDSLSWDAKFSLPNDNPAEELKSLSLEAASYSSDRLAYFYVTYASTHNEGDNLFPLAQGETYESAYKTRLQNASKGAKWEYYVGEDKLPSLEMDFAHTLYRYLRFSEGGQDGLNAHNYLISQYQGLFDDAGQILFKSNDYQNIYVQYRDTYAYCAHVISLFSFVSYVASYLLVILLPTLLFKRGETLGMFVFKGALLHKEKLDASKGQVLIRDLVCFFSFFPTMLFSCFFAGGLDSGWMYPLFTIGSAGVSFFNLTVIAFIIPIANLFFSLIRKDNCSLNELASQTIVVDRRYYQEVTPEETEPKEEEAKGTILPERAYFDSSCFNNTERKEIVPEEETKD